MLTKNRPLFKEIVTFRDHPKFAAPDMDNPYLSKQDKFKLFCQNDSNVSLEE